MKNTMEENYTVKVVKDVESGRVLSRAWFNAAGQEHNTSGPALVKYCSDGKPKEQRWMVDGKIHRPEEEGPAVIDYDPDDDTLMLTYFYLNRIHRVHGPAIQIKSASSGAVVSERYFRNGEPFQP